jgi:hypothetical protein
MYMYLTNVRTLNNIWEKEKLAACLSDTWGNIKSVLSYQIVWFMEHGEREVCRWQSYIHHPLPKCCKDNVKHSLQGLEGIMIGDGGCSAGLYLTDPTSPIPSHCIVFIIMEISILQVV